MRFSEEHMDQLLFDYVEGSLPATEKAILEKELLLDSTLQGELELWQSTFVNQEMLDTSNLETSIIQKIKPTFSIVNYLNILIVGSLVFLSGIQKENIQENMDISKNPVMQVKLPANAIEISRLDNIKPEIGIMINSTPKPIDYLENYSPEIDVINIKISSIELATKKSLPSGINEAILNKIPDAATSKKSYTPRNIKYKYNKTNKRHNKLKKRNRHSSGFIPGKVPYVVPMDSKNFY